MAIDKHRVLFPWSGGKSGIMEFIVPLFPPRSSIEHFVDAFGGSAQVILNVGTYNAMTYNDRDREVSNFFKCLRDYGDELHKALALTPYSRDEFAVACDPLPQGAGDIERARRFFIRARQTAGYGGRPNLKAYSWLRTVNTESGTKSYAWVRRVDDLPDFAEMLRPIQIENRDALKLIAEMDGPDVFFYCDPPYVHTTRKDKMESGRDLYAFEMDDAEHEALAETLHSIKGRAMVSGYACPLYDRIFADWMRIDDQERGAHSTTGRKGEPLSKRRDSVWINYSPSQGVLF